VITNVATAGSIAATDTIKLTFNQRTNLAAGTVRVCLFSAQKTILIGDTANCVASTDTYTVGKLVTTGTVAGNASFTTSTDAVTTVTPYTATITLAGAGPNRAIGAGTWTFTPAATILSFATIDQATMCSAANTNCQPTTTTTF